jgi:hypothetical protein
MGNKTPPARSTLTHTKAGTVLPASEATAIAAADTIIFQNNGNTILRFVLTLAGTATVKGTITPANDLAVTLTAPEMLLGPFDPGIFGTTVTITTATATGSVALYNMPPRYGNALCNPFQTDSTKPDSP